MLFQCFCLLCFVWCVGGRLKSKRAWCDAAKHSWDLTKFSFYGISSFAVFLFVCFLVNFVKSLYLSFLWSAQTFSFSSFSPCLLSVCLLLKVMFSVVLFCFFFLSLTLSHYICLYISHTSLFSSFFNNYMIFFFLFPT